MCEGTAVVSGNTIYCVTVAPCLCLEQEGGKRQKVRKQERDEVKHKGCFERKCLSMFFWERERENHTSFICCSPGDTFTSSTTLEYENSHLSPQSSVSPPFIHPFLIFQFHLQTPPPNPLWSALYRLPSQNPPTPYPSSSRPRLIPTLQRLVINVGFNCHAHFYAH